MSTIDIAEKVLIGTNRLYCEMKGKGPPVVFLHGGLVDSRMWDEQFELFAQKHSVVRYDLHGYGRSSMPETPYSPVDDLKTLLTFLQVGRAHLIGLSLGGSIAIEFALTCPSMVDHLVVASSDVRGYPPTPPDEDTKAVIDAVRRNLDAEAIVEMMLNHSLFASAKDNPITRGRMRTMLLSNYRAWTSGTPASLTTWPSVPAFERLSEIQKPTLILVGSSDTPDIVAIADTLKEGIKGGMRRVIRGAGHHMNMEKPDEFNQVVLDFLSEPHESQASVGLPN